MKSSDLVCSKRVLKSAGVMGSSLKPCLIFEGFGIIIATSDNRAKIMLSDSSLVWTMKKHLNVVSVCD